MSFEDTEELDSQNQSTDEVVNTDEVEVESHEDDTEDIEKLREQNRKLYERTKKAEELAKQLKSKVSATTQTSEKQDGELSAKDIILLSNSGIKESEDIDEVLDFAKYKKIPVAEALKNPTVKAILADKAEYRRSAEVANTSSSRRTSVKASDETILSNASQGKLPDDPEALAEARIRAKLAK
jgi:hypothetical protein